MKHLLTITLFICVASAVYSQTVVTSGNTRIAQINLSPTAFNNGLKLPVRDTSAYMGWEKLNGMVTLQPGALTPYKYVAALGIWQVLSSAMSVEQGLALQAQMASLQAKPAMGITATDTIHWQGLYRKWGTMDTASVVRTNKVYNDPAWLNVSASKVGAATPAYVDLGVNTLQTFVANTYQPKITAGANIVISGNVISAAASAPIYTNATLTQTASVIALTAGKRTLNITGVAGLLQSDFVTVNRQSTLAGYYILDYRVIANGTLEVQFEAPILAIGSSFAIPLRIKIDR